MHPSMAREIIRQRERDLHAQARKDGDAKAAHEAARTRRMADRAQQAAVPLVPDYPDGTFREAGTRPHAHA